MPSFLIPQSNAVKLAQRVTEGCTLQNISNSTIFLADTPDVSPTSFDLVLLPQSTVYWKPGNELYAISEADALLAISYSLDASGLGSASITGGVVDIGNNVRVQGGGELLADQTFTIQPLTNIIYAITEPPSGQRYPALRVSISLDAPGGTTEGLYTYYEFATDQGKTYTGSLTQPTPSASIVYLGLPNQHTFTIPFEGDYPMRGRIFPPPSGMPAGSTIRLQVWGYSAAVTRPETDLFIAFPSSISNTVAETSTLERRLYIPPSYTPYNLAIKTGSGGAGGGGTGPLNYFAYNRQTNSVIGEEADIQYNLYNDTRLLTANQKVVWPTPGYARANYIRLTPSTGKDSVVQFTAKYQS